jgi:hypothetical protein
MQALSNVKILEQALAKARANNADWKPILLNRPEDILTDGIREYGAVRTGFRTSFLGTGTPHRYSH